MGCGTTSSMPQSTGASLATVHSISDIVDLLQRHSIPFRHSACAWRSPSARRMSLFSPSAFKIADCRSPSATLIAASQVPVDSVTTARRFRSARKLAIHCILHIPRWNDFPDFHVSHFNTPFFSDLIQAGAESCVDLLAFERTPSNADSPITERNVVVAIPWAASSNSRQNALDWIKETR